MQLIHLTAPGWSLCGGGEGAILKTLDDLLAEGVTGRRVLVRADLNVPLDGEKITDDGRVRASLPRP